LTDRNDLYAKRVLLSKDGPFGGLDNIRIHLGVKPQNLPTIGVNRHFAAKLAR